jgi:hypothetical protein
MTDIRRTAFNAAGLAKGLTDSSGNVTGALNAGQLAELQRIGDAAGCFVGLPASVAGTYDEFVLAPVAAGADTNSIRIRANAVGSQVAGIGTNALKSITVTQGSDTTAASMSTGDITITLSNSTGAHNTLTLVKVALDALSLQSGTVFSTSIKGTASTQFATSSEDAVKTVPGGTVHGCILSTTAGAAASNATNSVTVTPS